MVKRVGRDWSQVGGRRSEGRPCPGAQGVERKKVVGGEPALTSDSSQGQESWGAGLHILRTGVLPYHAGMAAEQSFGQ